MVSRLLWLVVLVLVGIGMFAAALSWWLWRYERRRDAVSAAVVTDGFPDPAQLTIAEGRLLLGRRAWQHLDMDGPSFVRRYYAGELDGDRDDVAAVAQLLGYAGLDLGLDPEPPERVGSPRLTRLERGGHDG